VAGSTLNQAWRVRIDYMPREVVEGEKPNTDLHRQAPIESE
jgi:hypothetical protein